MLFLRFDRVMDFCLTVLLALGLCVGVAHAADLTPKTEPITMLDASGVDASLRVYLAQNAPWDVTNDETLVKILHRLPDFPRMMTESWAFPWNAETQAAVVADPGKWQGQFFNLRFTVLTLRKITLAPEAAERFGFSDYFSLEVGLAGTQGPGPAVTIFTRAILKTWQDKVDASDKVASIDEPGSAVAMFLKTGGKGDDEGQGGVPPFYFAADRVAWHPDTIAGKLGMDVGLFDIVRDRKKIDAQEREPFYQLLAAVGRAKPKSLIIEAKAELGKDKDGRQKWTPVASLFNEPQKMRGKLALLRGRVRRAIRVEVRDPDIVERFGIRYYYELYLFTKDSQSNPIVVCVRELPKGMPIGSGRSYSQQVEVAAIMLKSWAFEAGKDVQEGGERQLAPLLIGREPILIQPVAKSESPWFGAMMAAGLVVGLFVIWFFLRRQAKADQAARRRRQER